MSSGMVEPGRSASHYLHEAHRDEIIGAWSAAVAAALVAFVPYDGAFRAIEAAAVLAALAAALLLATHKPGIAEWLLGGSLVVLLVVSTVAVSYDLALDHGVQGAVLGRAAIAVVVLAFAIARFKRAERSRRMSWGSRRIAELERRRALHEQLMNEDPDNPVFPPADPAPPDGESLTT